MTAGIKSERVQGRSRGNLPVFAVFVIIALVAGVQPTVAGELPGPDLLGLRVGMTPEEALPILKTRAPKEKWQTVRVKLQFQNSKQMNAHVPNGEFQAVLENKRVHSALNHYVVFLTPTPGEERVAAVLRIQNFGEERPLFTQVIAGLIEKYGNPSYSQDPQYGGGKLVWAFDTNGKPRPMGIPKSIQNVMGFPCTNGVALPYLDREVVGWSTKYEPLGKAFDIGGGKPGNVSYVNACGSTMVRATVIPFGGLGGEFAQGLTVELIGHSLATAGKQSADKLTESAIADDLARERGAAQKRSKPDI